jgi:hypothetical protein
MIRQLLAFFVVSFALAAGMPQKNEGHSSLHPPLPAPYPTAEGWIHLTNDGSQQKFAAKALSLPMTAPPGPFEVWLENGLASNVYFLVGPMIQSNTKVKNLRDWELVLTATGGAPAALGVANVDDLAGRRLQIRDSMGAISLEGYCPALFAPGAPKIPITRAPMYYQRNEPAIDKNVLGHFHAAKLGDFQVFETNIFKAPVLGVSFGVYLETGVGTNVFFLVNGMTLEQATIGHWRMRIAAQGGAPPALGVADVTQLAGRTVQIRDAQGGTYLWEVLPALSANPGQTSFTKKHALAIPAVNPPAPAAKGSVALRFSGGSGRSVFEVQAKNLPSSLLYGVFVETSLGSGVFDKVGNLHFKLSSPTIGKLNQDTKVGEPLPLGVADLSQLSGLKLEIRDGSGTVFLATVLP